MNRSAGVAFDFGDALLDLGDNRVRERLFALGARRDNFLHYRCGSVLFSRHTHPFAKGLILLKQLSIILIFRGESQC
jgi:hypothetical protein